MISHGLTSFNPKNLSSLVVWLDAANPSNNGTWPSSGSALTTWVDVAGNAGNFSGSNSPIWSTNVQNGLPGVAFNGTNQYFSQAQTTKFDLTSGLSIFMVAKLTQNVNALWMAKKNGSGASFQVGYPSQTEGQYCNNLACVYSAPSSILNNCDLQLWTTAAGGTNMYINSANVYNDAVSNLPNTISASTWIGSDQGVSNFFKGNMHEILVFNVELSAGQQALVNDYLRRKWALY